MAVNIHITIIELNAQHTKRQNLFHELDAGIDLLMEAKHWGLRKSRNATRITENLWGFAQFDLLEDPLPCILKERLFVYLSRFSEVRYCIVRHHGFLVGLGHAAGDSYCPA